MDEVYLKNEYISDIRDTLYKMTEKKANKC